LTISFILCIFSSCSNDSNDTDILENILKKYKTNGLTTWWEVVAIYNADENPADYKNFKELCLSLEGATNLKMASYVTVANIAIICGMDSGEFDKYEEYKSNLKNLLENPTNDFTLNDYIFGYFALKCSGTDFEEEPVLNYFEQAQKSDGGFALTKSAELGDVDVTAFAIPFFQLIYRNDGPVMSRTDVRPRTNAVEFLENRIGENGTFASYGNENANSTACALSALIGYYNYLNETIRKGSEGLDIFIVQDKKDVGYSFLIGGKIDTLATAQAAIALGDLKNKMSVWEKLYLDSVAEFNPEK